MRFVRWPYRRKLCLGERMWGCVGLASAPAPSATSVKERPKGLRSISWGEMFDSECASVMSVVLCFVYASCTINALRNQQVSCLRITATFCRSTVSLSDVGLYCRLRQGTQDHEELLCIAVAEMKHGENCQSLLIKPSLGSDPDPKSTNCSQRCILAVLIRSRWEEEGGYGARACFQIIDPGDFDSLVQQAQDCRFHSNGPEALARF